MSDSNTHLPNWLRESQNPNQENTLAPDWMVQNQETVAAAKYKVWLKSQMALPPYSSSTQEENPYTLLPDNESYDLYTQVLPEYSYHPPSDSDKFDYNNPNIGYKFHLNVPLEHVIEVSSYLKDNGYNHKYLKGGDVSDGKVFTIYIGSKDLADKLAQVLSHDLVGLLRRPRVQNSVELAPGIAARFNQLGYGFSRYPSSGVIGFNVLDGLNSFGSNYDHKLAKLAFEISFNKLVELHGVYFTGS